MRKLRYLLILCLSLTACTQKGRDQYTWIYIRSLITSYRDGEIEASVYIHKKDYIAIDFTLAKNYKYYYAPELGAVGESAERFVEIAQRNGDRNYDREVMWGPGSGHRCWADNFKSLQVICTNTAWDDKHPAGTSLNDLLRIRYTSYASYIQSGYKEWGDLNVVKPLSELKETDLDVISIESNVLYFDVFPAPGSYDLEVSLVTTEGVEKKATCNVKIK